MIKYARRNETPLSGASGFGRKEIRREGKGQHSTRGRMCVSSFARVNTWHPRAEGAERQKGKGTPAHGSEMGSKGNLFF